jgi:hypothetical protein
VDQLKNLKALDLSGNKLKDWVPIRDLVNKLPNIEWIALDNNPCWQGFEPELRIKFLGGISQMINLGASLKYLNGYEISIAERVRNNYANLFDILVQSTSGC